MCKFGTNCIGHLFIDCFKLREFGDFFLEKSKAVPAAVIPDFHNESLVPRTICHCNNMGRRSEVG